MVILQYRIENTNEDELELLDEFNEWITDLMFMHLNTKLNRKKIQLRINHLYKVSWISWKRHKYIDTEEIMDSIYKSFLWEPMKDCKYKIQIDTNQLIPSTNTSIDRLIRFLDYGDNTVRGTSMFTKLSQEFNYNKLNLLWNMFIQSKLNYLTQAKLIVW